MANTEKIKALESALQQIEKQYGKGSVMKLGDTGANMNVEVVPSGSLSLDAALGLGGFPKGRIVEIYGPESSGKTTVALHMVAEVQKRGGIAGFIDAEHALDPNYAKALGVDVDSMYICQPDCGEQALEVADKLIQYGVTDICVIDSVAKSLSVPTNSFRCFTQPFCIFICSLILLCNCSSNLGKFCACCVLACNSLFNDAVNSATWLSFS